MGWADSVWKSNKTNLSFRHMLSHLGFYYPLKNLFVKKNPKCHLQCVPVWMYLFCFLLLFEWHYILYWVEKYINCSLISDLVFHAMGSVLVYKQFNVLYNYVVYISFIIWLSNLVHKSTLFFKNNRSKEEV